MPVSCDRCKLSVQNVRVCEECYRKICDSCQDIYSGLCIDCTSEVVKSPEKHIEASAKQAEIADDWETFEDYGEEVIEDMGDYCPECGSYEYDEMGLFETETQSRRKCKECGYEWTIGR